MGYPPSQNWVPSCLGLGAPLRRDLGPVTGVPQKGHGTSVSIMGWRLGTPRKDMEPVEVLWNGDGVPPPRV